MWKLLTDGFPFVLTGRKWIADGAVCIYAAGHRRLGLRCALAGEPSGAAPTSCFRLLPGSSCLVAIVKSVAAVAGVSDGDAPADSSAGRTFLSVLAGWSAFVGLAIALAMLVQPPTGFVSKPILFLGIATFVPLVTISAGDASPSTGTGIDRVRAIRRRQADASCLSCPVGPAGV